MSASTSFHIPILRSEVLPIRTHQLVVIAKPGPDQPYRKLASAIQSCNCSQHIMKTCLNALRALSNSDTMNRVAVLQEVSLAADYQAVGANLELPADVFYQQDGLMEADHMFPYITATLISSMAACCLEQQHAGYRCSLEAPFHISQDQAVGPDDPIYWDCQSFMDITVGIIDITDLSKPRYCFLNMDQKCVRCGLWWYHEFGRNVTQVDEMVPWNKTEFMPLSCDALLSAMALESQVTVQLQSEVEDSEAMEALRSYALVDVSALSSCWPSTAWKSSDQLQAPSNQPQDPKKGVKPLSELSLGRLLDGILLGLLDSPEMLNEPMRMPRVQKSFLAICAARVDEIAAFEDQETIVGLFSRLLEDVKHVDLYPFRQLPKTTILGILHSHRLKNMKSLNLSGLFAGTPGDFWTTLDSIPHQPEEVLFLSADNSSMRPHVMRGMPHHIGQVGFWERCGSKKIVVGAAISTELYSYCLASPSLYPHLKLMYLGYLRNLISGDTSRLQTMLQSVRPQG